MSILLSTEDGKVITCESVPGITGISSLNDIAVKTINKELFDTDPVARGWLVGTDWQWDGTNKYMKII